MLQIKKCTTCLQDYIFYQTEVLIGVSETTMVVQGVLQNIFKWVVIKLAANRTAGTILKWMTVTTYWFLQSIRKVQEKRLHTISGYKKAIVPVSMERTNHGKQAFCATVRTAIGQEDNKPETENQSCIQHRSVYSRQRHGHYRVLETKMDYYYEQRYKQTSTQYRWGWDEFPMWAVLLGTNTQVPGYAGGVK